MQALGDIQARHTDIISLEKSIKVRPWASIAIKGLFCVLEVFFGKDGVCFWGIPQKAFTSFKGFA